MAKPDKFAIGIHPEHGKLWAAIDGTTVPREGRVAQRRFSAFLAPFRSRAEAENALVAAGCTLEGVVT